MYLCLSSYCVLCMCVCLRTVYCVCCFSSYCVLCMCFVFVLCIVYVCLSSYCVLYMFICLRTMHCVPTVPLPDSPICYGVTAEHHCSFQYCVFYFILFYFVLPPVFDGTITLCYTNIQTCLVLMTIFFCSHRCRLNTNSPHSHPFHQICISEEWIQICFSAISELLHILGNQHCHHCMSVWNSLCHLTMKLHCVCWN